jgi:cobalt-zinc-cadmium resistance protein CzcA
VKYNRAKIARYGVNIKQLNDMLSMGFSGKTVGNVFEGEKRFDLVVRLDKDKRQNIEDIKNLYVDLPAGGKVPLSELADITFQKGAAKISRDDTKRRIVVGVNVRNRDLQSVVDDVQKLINENIKLPAGYTITYGGQFENLQSATKRLMIAVPIALVLIFVLLYFAFESVKDAIMIFSAIPLSAVGGVLLLWIRDLPFSISAGVGFIALFGIAVLNGIVLIEHFKELKKQGFESMEELIKQGTKDRLRAVLLTASAAALGFLPMAISTNAGAEVQRPLATVVIGGLVTATMLTLIVLPVLYSLFNKPYRSKRMRGRMDSKKVVSVILVLVSFSAFSQQEPALNLENLIPLAIENNAGLKSNKLQVDESDALINSAFNFDKTQVYYSYDENNLAINNRPIEVFGIQQDFQFPTVYFSEKKVNKERYSLASSAYDIQEKGIKRKVTAAYYDYQIAREKQEVYKRLDSLYTDFSKIATRRFELGETNYLEKITATSKQKQVHIKYTQTQKDVELAYNGLLKVVQITDTLIIAREPSLKVDLGTLDLNGSAELGYYQNKINLLQAERRFEKQKLLPDISLNYFQGSNSGLNGNLYGYQLGLKIPILFGGQSSKIKASRIAEDIAVAESSDYEIQLKAKYNALKVELVQIQEALSYYENEGEKLSEEILKTANGSFRNGEIDFYQYIQSLESAYEIKLSYLDKLNQYNQTIIAINYLTL